MGSCWWLWKSLMIYSRTFIKRQFWKFMDTSICDFPNFIAHEQVTLGKLNVPHRYQMTCVETSQYFLYAKSFSCATIWAISNIFPLNIFEYQPKNETYNLFLYLWHIICAPFHKHILTLIQVWINNYNHFKVWGEFFYPFPNFNGATVEVWEWISDFIPRLPGVWLKLHHASKRGSKSCIFTLFTYLASHQLFAAEWHIYASVNEAIISLDNGLLSVRDIPLSEPMMA